MTHGAAITTREAAAADGPFLFRVFASTRADEFAMLPLPHEQKAALLRQQFGAQQSHYRREHPQARTLVIERGGMPAGSLCLAQAGDAVTVVDIALLPELRGQGIGTRVLSEVVADAGERPVVLSALRASPARRLYERLGFTAVASAGLHVRMVRGTSAREAS